MIQRRAQKVNRERMRSYCEQKVFSAVVRSSEHAFSTKIDSQLFPFILRFIAESGSQATRFAPVMSQDILSPSTSAQEIRPNARKSCLSCTVISCGTFFYLGKIFIDAKIPAGTRIWGHSARPVAFTALILLGYPLNLYDYFLASLSSVSKIS